MFGSAAQNRSLYVRLAGLYLAQSLPLYLVASALPAILRERGIDLAVIGAFSVLLAPWVLKLFWAPWVDRAAAHPRIGRRGSVACCQIVTILSLLALANLDPLTDAARFFPLLMLMSVATATQDVASDGWAVEHLPPAQQPLGNGIQAAAVAAGVVLGGAGTLILYDVVGWTGAVLTIAACSALSVLPFLAVPERAGQRPLPQERDRASLRRFWARGGAPMMLVFALLFRLPEGLVKALEQPFLVDMGFNMSQIGFLSGASAAIVGIFGAATGALLINAIGLVRFLVLLVVGRTAVYAAFALAAYAGIGIWPLVALSAVDTFLRYVEIVALTTVFMRFASLSQAGTDFTLLSAATLAMFMIGGVLAGVLAQSAGYTTVFIVAMILSAVTGWLALARLPAQVRARPNLSPTGEQI